MDKTYRLGVWKRMIEAIGYPTDYTPGQSVTVFMGMMVGDITFHIDGSYHDQSNSFSPQSRMLLAYWELAKEKGVLD